MISLYSKKYQIFISSTYTDLVLAREEVTKVILNLYQIPIGMEMFSADNDEQWEVIQSTIENSDYYLLVLGHRYGSVTKEGISYTEKEFDYAKSLGIPVIAFVRNRNIATKPNERDSDHALSIKLDDFYKKVTDNAMCDFWETEHELGQKVAISLVKIFTKNPRVGWTKAVASTIQTTEELTTLSKENRQLREEVEQLRASIAVDVPIIKVNLNDDALISLKLLQPQFDEFKTVSAIPEDLRDLISNPYVKTYNALLESKKDSIDHYKSLFTLYTNKVNNNTSLKINISNNGAVKAHDVYVDITFPKEIYLFEKTDNITEPKKPFEESHPFNMARSKIRNARSTLHSLSAMSFSNSGLKALAPINLNFKRRSWIDKESNKLTVRLDSLLHTRSVTIDEDIVIAPLLKGEFTIDVSIICNEYRERHNEIIPIRVL